MRGVSKMTQFDFGATRRAKSEKRPKSHHYVLILAVVLIIVFAAAIVWFYLNGGFVINDGPGTLIENPFAGNGQPPPPPSFP